MAEVGGTRKVIGSRMATPLTEPSPGMAPMNRPITTPITTKSRLRGSKATRKPSMRWAMMSIGCSYLRHERPRLRSSAGGSHGPN